MADEPVKQLEMRKNLNSMLIPSDVFEGYRPDRVHWGGGVASLKNPGLAVTNTAQNIAERKRAFKAAQDANKEKNS
ncbi:MAG: hypothetical protein GC131_03440 [Alphaproteobacteria bacterium]|nr:hypothetical protein [Alphaproteobacteria bacterium]